MRAFRWSVLPFLLAASAVCAQEPVSQSVSATVAARNVLRVATGGTLTFAPSTARAATATDVLEYETNDGKGYRVTLAADPEGWSFEPAVAGVAAGEYPVLSFEGATASAGLAATVPAPLLAADNTAVPTVDVVTDIRSVVGRAEVTLRASAGQRVVAGVYRTRLTYSFVAP